MSRSAILKFSSTLRPDMLILNVAKTPCFLPGDRQESMSEPLPTNGQVEPHQPFRVEVAERMKRLPPYLFARINALMYQKRRAGADVIDLGMGNPSEPPQDIVIEKLAEAARDPANQDRKSTRLNSSHSQI